MTFLSACSSKGGAVSGAGGNAGAVDASMASGGAAARKAVMVERKRGTAARKRVGRREGRSTQARPMAGMRGR